MQMVSSGIIRHPPKSNALCSLLKYFHQFPQIRPFHGHYRSSFSPVVKTTVRQHHEEVEHMFELSIVAGASGSDAGALKNHPAFFFAGSSVGIIRTLAAV